MEIDASSAENDCSILALNDDCLITVFEHLDWWDLVAVMMISRRSAETLVFVYSK